MQNIEDIFARTFAHWGLRVPKARVRTRTRGAVRKEGWTIQFLFGENDRGEYMDYYASHRMADDSHIRIYADGSTEALPVIVSGYWTSDDPVEAEESRARYFAENQAVAEQLAAKGFGLSLNSTLRATDADGHVSVGSE